MSALMVDEFIYLFCSRRKKFIDAYFSNFVIVLSASKMRACSFPFSSFTPKREVMTHSLILGIHSWDSLHAFVAKWRNSEMISLRRNGWQKSVHLSTPQRVKILKLNLQFRVVVSEMV